jgi:hypothetical protein
MNNVYETVISVSGFGAYLRESVSALSMITAVYCRNLADLGLPFPNLTAY